MDHWLIKSEPDAFSFDDLLAAPGRTTPWEGVRNFQARNFMRDAMRPGQRVLYYHSNTAEPGVVGLSEVASEPYPDPSQFDPAGDAFDPKASPEEPRWLLVEVRALERLPRTVTLAELKAEPALADSPLVRRGNRLSVVPLTPGEFEAVLTLAGHEGGDA